MTSFPRITFDPGVMGGKACIRNLRVTVGTVVGLLAAGRTAAEILHAYPCLERDDIDQCLAYAAWRLEKRDDVCGWNAGVEMTTNPELLTRISARPDVFGGKPIIRDMRISVELILSLLAQQVTTDGILEDYPELEPDDISACIAYAHAVIANLPPAAVRR